MRSQAKLDTAFDSAAVSPGLLLWQLTNKWQARQRKALAPFGLTHVQFVLLASLVWHGNGPLTQKELAGFTKIDVMMTSQVVRKLEEKGLLTRTNSENDARSLLLRPTPRGATLANQAVKAVEAIDLAFFAVLGADLVNFVAMMQLLAHQG